MQRICRNNHFSLLDSLARLYGYQLERGAPWWSVCIAWGYGSRLFSPSPVDWILHDLAGGMVILCLVKLNFLVNFYSDSSWCPDALLIFLYVSYVTDYSDYEDSSLEFLERCSSPLTRSSGSSLALRSMFTEKNTTYQYPRAILSVDLSGESMCNHVMLKQVLRLLNGELSWKHTSFSEGLSEHAIEEVIPETNRKISTFASWATF